MTDKISLDLESTLADIREPFYNEYEKRHGVRPSTSSEWNFGDVDHTLREFLKITGSNWKHRASMIPPTEKALMNKVSVLYDASEKLDIVTGRVGHESKMKAWLDGHGIVYDDFVVVDSQEEKSRLDYDVFIDDCPKHIPHLDIDQELYLYDQPYNRGFDLPGNVYRVRSFRDVLELADV